MPETRFDYRIEERWIETPGGPIYGLLFTPEGAGASPLIIHSHGLGYSHRTGEDYARHFAARGLRVLLYDFRNGGRKSRSGNDLTKMSVATERDDLLAVLAAAKVWPGVSPDRIVLLGASQGGFVSTMVAAERPAELAGLICIYPAYLIRTELRNAFDTLEQVPETFDLQGWFMVGRCYAADAWDVDIYARMADFPKPVLLLHGDRDPVVDPAYSRRAAEAFPNAAFYSIPGGAHGFSGAALEEAIGHIEQYLSMLGLL